MYKMLSRLLLTTTCVFLIGNLSQKVHAFTHPGVLLAQSDLDRMKTNIAAGNQPWKGAYLSLKASMPATYIAQPTATVTSDYQIRYDSSAAFNYAVLWYATGNASYKTTAINIINAWSSTLTSFDITSHINAYIAAEKFAAAGEILRYEGSGWASSDITKCENMLKNLLYPVVEDGLVGTSSGTPGDGGQGAGNMRAIMAIGIFCNDTAKYNEAVTAFKSNTCVAVTKYIDSNGCPGESGRDQAHSQGAVANYLEAAQMAWCQGLDLYSFSSNRVLVGVEWLAKYNLGNSAVWTNTHTCYSTYYALSAIDRGQWTMMYELAYNHYVVLKGISAPYTTQVAARLRPESVATDDPGIGTLLFSLNSRPASEYKYNGTYEIISKLSGKALGLVGTNTGQDTKIEQRTYTGATNQKWAIMPLGNNYYKIVNSAAAGGLTTDSGAAPSTSGVAIHLWQDGNGDNQIWQIVDAGSGYVKIFARDTILMPMPITQLLWDVTGNSTADGALIEMYTDHSGNNQLFQLTQ